MTFPPGEGDVVIDIPMKALKPAAWTPTAPASGSEVSFAGCVIVPIVDPDTNQTIAWRCLNHEIEAPLKGPRRYYCATVPCDLRRFRRKRAARSEGASDFLSADDFRRLYLAVARGNMMGFTFDAFATIAWANVGVTTDPSVSAAMQSLQVRLREWATRKQVSFGSRGVPLAWVWVHERGPIAGALHTHLLLSVPERYRADLGLVIYEHVEQVSERVPDQGIGGAVGDPSQTLRITAPRNRAGRAPAFEKDILEFQWRRLRYMAKGSDPKAYVRVNKERILLSKWAALDGLEGQGRVVGKRAGYSGFSLGTPVWSAWTTKHHVDPRGYEDRLRARGPAYDDAFLVAGYSARMGI